MMKYMSLFQQCSSLYKILHNLTVLFFEILNGPHVFFHRNQYLLWSNYTEELFRVFQFLYLFQPYYGYLIHNTMTLFIFGTYDMSISLIYLYQIHIIEVPKAPYFPGKPLPEFLFFFIAQISFTFRKLIIPYNTIIIPVFI